MTKDLVLVVFGGCVTALLFCSCGTTQKEILSTVCHTPEALMQSMEYALRTHDTNLYWNLHCFTDYPPKLEQFQWAVMMTHIPDAGDKFSVGNFKIVSTHPAVTPFVNSAKTNKLSYNLEVEGVITAFEKRHFASGGRAANILTFPFGKTASGDYRVALLIPANTNRPAQH